MGNTQIKKEKEEFTKNLETLAVITNANCVAMWLETQPANKLWKYIKYEYRRTRY